MTNYLLDTNVISALLRQPRGTIKDRIEDVGEDAVWTSIVVASELRFGARKKGSDKLIARVDAFLASIRVVPLDHPADEHYAAVQRQSFPGARKTTCSPAATVAAKPGPSSPPCCKRPS